MHVSAKADYALRALVEITQDADGSPLSAEAIGRKQDIPRQFLQSILADLRRAGVVRAQRGQGGGWLLAREPEAISVADVMRAVEGPLVSVHGLRPESVTYLPDVAALQTVWIAARGALRGILESTTIAHLAAGDVPPVVAEHSSDRDAWEPR